MPSELSINPNPQLSCATRLRCRQWNLVGVVLYLTLLDAMPLAIVLAYNRMAPLSTSSPSVDRGRGRNPGFEVRRRAPEEEPLITGTGTGRRYEAGNPFLEEHPGVHA